MLKVFRVTKDNIDDVRQMIEDLGYNFDETFANKSHPSKFIAYGVDSLGQENIADGMIGELLAVNLIGAVYSVEEDLLFSMIDPICVEGPLANSKFAF